MANRPLNVPADILAKFGTPEEPIDFAATVGKIMSVPADQIPPEAEMPKNPKGRPRKGADYGQQAIG